MARAGRRFPPRRPSGGPGGAAHVYYGQFNVYLGASTVAREWLSAEASGGTLSVTTGAGTQPGDTLVIWHANNFGAASALPAPTGPTVTLVGTGDSGNASSNGSHVKLWTAVATGGAQTISAAASPSGEEHVLVVAVLPGRWQVDGTAQGNGSQTASTSLVCNAVTPVGAADVLLTAAASDGNATVVTNITAPAGTTRQAYRSDPTFGMALAVGEETLSGSGTTGTRTYTSTPAGRWSTLSATVRPVLVQRKTNATTVTAASLSVTLDRTPTQGNLMVIRATSTSGSGLATPSGWTLRASETANIPNNFIFDKVAGAAESATVTVSTGAAGGIAMVVDEYLTYTSVDKNTTGQTTTAGTSLAVGPTAATSQADEILLAGFSVTSSTGTSGTPPTYSSMTGAVLDFQQSTNVSVTNSPLQQGVGYALLSATGAQTVTANLSGTAANLSGIVVTYQPAGGTSSGAATITGAGSVAASGSVIITGAATVTGTGSTVAAATGLGAATVAGAGSTSATARVIVPGTATVTGAGSVTAGAAGAASGTASVTGAGSTTAAATVTARGTASVTGAGSVAAVGMSRLRTGAQPGLLALGATQPAQSAPSVPGTGTGSASVTGAGSVAAAGTVVQRTTATIAGTGSVTAVSAQSAQSTASAAGSVTAAVVQLGNAAITAAGTVTASANGSLAGSATATGTGSVAATGVIQAVTATVAGAGTATAATGQQAGSTVTGTGTVAAAVVLRGSSSVTGAGTVTGNSNGSSTGASTITGAGTVSAGVVQVAGATLTGAGTVSATSAQQAGAAVTGAGSVTAGAVQRASSTVTGAGSVTAGALGTITGAASAAGTGSVTAAGTVILRAAATVAGQGFASGAGAITGTAAVTGTGASTAAVVQRVIAVINGTGSVTATVGQTILGTATVTGAGSVVATGRAKYVTRPFTGTTSRPGTGITARPVGTPALTARP